VVVNNGTLSNGQIVVAASTYTTPSYANQYDAAGNVAVRSTLAFSGDQIPDVRRGLVRPYGGRAVDPAAGVRRAQ
jgi:autotransporter adhesin